MNEENNKILKGTIEKIVYANADDGYTVARLALHRRQEPVVIVGHLSGIREGEQIKASGCWQRNPKFGDQFRVSQFDIIPPSTSEGIEKYLSSGLIRGIGPVMAGRIVQKFGSETLRILDEMPQRLGEVPGIGAKTLDKIMSAWGKHRDLRETMIFLQGLGISPALAGRITKEYGNDTIRIIRKNPYRLTYDIYGIGFKQADAIAMRMGIQHDSPERAAAAVVHVLNEATAEGHVYVPVHSLVERCQRLLDLSSSIIEQGMDALIRERKVVVENIDSLSAVYLAALHKAETGAAELLKFLRSSLKLLPPIHVERAVRWFERRHSIHLNTAQREAIKNAVNSKILIITGGPGTGKTTIIRAFVEIFRAKNQKVLLAAPTGRAAKRMELSAGIPAATVHRLLEFSPASMEFVRNAENPIECDLLIIDETSMLDIVLLYHLLKAVPHEAAVILLGDADQLPSVGPGNVLRDLLQSDFADVVRLTEIFRQEEGSFIISNAHRINRGESPVFLHTDNTAKTDFHFIERKSPEEVVSTIETLVCHRIPDAFKFDPLTEIQILSPMHRGTAGIENLNMRLQHLLNPSGREIEHGLRRFRLRDKVMQVRNNYDKETFNGDIGVICSVNSDSQEVEVDFDGRLVPYEYAELDELELAYAITVHKSQGSEYPAVVVPVINQHYILLQRNLIYTAITRAKELVVLVGSPQALSTAIQNNKIQHRNTLLSARLKS